MKLTTSQSGEVTILEISGELNHESVARWNEAVTAALKQGHRDFVVDLRQLEGVDSVGLEAFTSLQRQCEEQLGMVRFCAPDPTLRKTFELTRLDRTLGLHESTEEALSSFV